LIEVLDRVEALAKETPPVDNATSRFGNPAFKTFYDKVQQVRCIVFMEIAGFTADLVYSVGLSPLQAAPRFHEQVLRVRPLEAIIEVSGYFCESWGNRMRIDYGSGMELNFLCWLCVFVSYSSFRIVV
jgi:serine/threonine-protein phosphatase 2A activator